MDPVPQIFQFWLWSLAAGLLGAGVMTGLMAACTRLGFAKVRMMVALGSLLTRGYERAALVGGFMHVMAGIIFGQFYTLVLLAIGQPGLGPNLLWGAALGALHGLIMTLVLLAAVAEVHPLEEFQQRGFAVALSHFVGHIAYGLVVGAIIGASGLVQPR